MTKQKNSADISLPWSELMVEAKRRFGIKRLRPGQRAVLEAVMTGRDVIGVMPTGAGKSLCYQLPALFLPRAVVVVSPLLALMQDQRDKAEDAQIDVQKSITYPLSLMTLNRLTPSQHYTEKDISPLFWPNRLVNAHSERFGRDQHLVLPGHEPGVRRFAVARAHAAVVPAHCNTRVR